MDKDMYGVAKMALSTAKSRMAGLMIAVVTVTVSGCGSVGGTVGGDKVQQEFPTYGFSCDSCLYDLIDHCRAINKAPVAAVVRGVRSVASITTGCLPPLDDDLMQWCSGQSSVLFEEVIPLRGDPAPSSEAYFATSYDFYDDSPKVKKGIVLEDEQLYLIFGNPMPAENHFADFNVWAACKVDDTRDLARELSESK